VRSGATLRRPCEIDRGGEEEGKKSVFSFFRRKEGEGEKERGKRPIWANFLGWRRRLCCAIGAWEGGKRRGDADCKKGEKKRGADYGSLTIP